MAVVYVIGKNKKPLSPTNEVRATELLRNKKAVVHRISPLVIRLRENKNNNEDFIIKIDPGSKVTGMAIVKDNKVYEFIELIHRGAYVKKLMTRRKFMRRSRRNRNTRYRPPRFLNRKRKEGWLPPSVKSRADNVINIVKKLQKYIPIKYVMLEYVSFDTAKMTEGRELSRAEYTQGPLYQKKLREVVKSKTNCMCGYCGINKGKEIEHIIARANGGTNSIKNLIFSCRKCNELKGTKTLKEFGKLMKKDFSHLEPKKTPKDAAIVQSARNYMIKKLQEIAVVETFPAWETSYNRKELGYEKEHYYDAMCVGRVPESFKIKTKSVLVIQAMGRGHRQMQQMNAYGFPAEVKVKGKVKTTLYGKVITIAPRSRTKTLYGFRTGDIVKAKGIIGRITVISTGHFRMMDGDRLMSVKYDLCEKLENNDGYKKWREKI